MFAVIVLGALGLVGSLVVVRVFRRWAKEYCEGMICAFGLPPLGEETETERVCQPEKGPVGQWILSWLFSLQRLAKSATSYLLS